MSRMNEQSSEVRMATSLLNLTLRLIESALSQKAEAKPAGNCRERNQGRPVMAQRRTNGEFRNTVARQELRLTDFCSLVPLVPLLVFVRHFAPGSPRFTEMALDSRKVEKSLKIHQQKRP